MSEAAETSYIGTFPGQAVALTLFPDSLEIYLGSLCHVAMQLPLAPTGESYGVSRSGGICNPSCIFWICSKFSSQLDVPGIPPQGSVQKAS